MRARGNSAVLVLRQALATLAMATAMAVVVVPHALAQQPTPKAQPKVEPKTQPKVQQKSAPPPPQTPQQGEQPQITYSPWTKVCPKGQEANAKRICFTGKDGRVEGGMVVVAAVLIEPEGEPRKVLRVTLPLGMVLQPGTRVVIDQGQPMNAPYVICFPNGCMADYEASEELITKMKKGQSLMVQGVNGSGQSISLPLPLADFAKAHDGPPSEPKQ